MWNVFPFQPIGAVYVLWIQNMYVRECKQSRQQHDISIKSQLMCCTCFYYYAITNHVLFRAENTWLHKMRHCDTFPMKIITLYWNNIREKYYLFPQSSLHRERPLWSEVFRIAFINKMVTAADGCAHFRSAGSKHQTQLQELCGLWKAHFILYI